MAEILYLSASEHKRRSLTEGLNALGRKDVHFLNPPTHAPEPDLLSPVTALLKTVMFLRQPEIKQQVGELLLTLGSLWVVTMDVNGIVPNAHESTVLTSTRGKTSSVLKLAETIEVARRASADGVGRIIFDNLCGPILVNRDGHQSWRGLLERAQLGLSPKLMRVMGDQRVWRKVVEASERAPRERPLDNPGATGGVDWSILPLYLPVIATTLGESNLAMSWLDQAGQVWRADEQGYESGMVETMTRHLRGFPERTLRGIAELN